MKSTYILTAKSRRTSTYTQGFGRFVPPLPRQTLNVCCVLLLPEHTGSGTAAKYVHTLKFPKRAKCGSHGRHNGSNSSQDCLPYCHTMYIHMCLPVSCQTPPTLEPPITESPPLSPPIPRAIAFAASAPLARVKAAWRALSFATVDVVQISGAQKHQVPSGCVSWCLSCHVISRHVMSCDVMPCQVQFSPRK